MEASITLKEVAKIYNKNMLLADLSFGIKQGSNFVIIGKNGSGKSTILKIISGVVNIDNGTVYINGKNINTRPLDVKQHIGYSPQTPLLDTNLNLYQNIDLYARLYGVGNNEINASILNWFNFFGISKYLKLYPENVSFGVQKIVSFIRSIIHMPDILILDEPTMGLEPNQKTKIWDSINRHFINKTIIFTSQDFNEAERYADQIAILHNGNIKISGSQDHLMYLTQGIPKYTISFSVLPDEMLVNKIKSIPRIVKPVFSGFELEFYAKERQVFFEVLKVAIDAGLKDMDAGLSTLEDLFINYVNEENVE